MRHVKHLLAVIFTVIVVCVGAELSADEVKEFIGAVTASSAGNEELFDCIRGETLRKRGLGLYASIKRKCFEATTASGQNFIANHYQTCFDYIEKLYSRGTFAWIYEEKGNIRLTFDEICQKLMTKINSNASIDRIGADVGWIAGPSDYFNGKTYADFLLMNFHPSNILKGRLLAETSGKKDNSKGEAVPESFDYRSKWTDCVANVDIQGECGSCFAVATARVLSIRFCIASKGEVKPNLSSQPIISCNELTRGCQGGWPIDALRYIDAEGLTDQQCTPYESGNGITPHCESKCTDGHLPPRVYKIKENSIKMMNQEKQIKQEILTNGPVVTVMEATY
eukprot:TRINITY_DN3274_c0_g1_i3.p1 TRINITY_DN3274_c0_g1~~TRINITY_DN3274_c0_g1_i3.p1  ORF type:complete len:338 (+),score=53.16 TRINITY_DN3274_c0_g1_i3:143-1156(+)